MKKRSFVILFIVLSLSFIFLSARSYRVDMMPYGDKWSCNSCHVAGGGTPRNPYGQAVEAITASSEASFWGASLAAADSDGDGFSNGVELQDSAGTWTSGANPGTASLVTHPGDASDYPATSAIWEIPANYELGHNYPNPFNPVTTFEYDLPLPSDVRIDIYNILGVKVKTLVNEYQTQGFYRAVWNGQNDLGDPQGSGIYIYRISAGEFNDAKRMILLK